MHIFLSGNDDKNKSQEDDNISEIILHQKDCKCIFFYLVMMIKINLKKMTIFQRLFYTRRIVSAYFFIW